MTSERCSELQLLIQADLDNELAPAEAARVGAHLADCAACRALQAQLLALSGRIRRDAPYAAAPDALRQAVQARLASAPDRLPPPALPASLAGQPFRRAARWRTALPFGAGFALAACIALVVIAPGDGGPQDDVVASHVRALQPGHLLDVVSTDQHTVKPWFDGRLDFAPPVKDLKAAGFPLAGGRLDYLAGRPVAVLVYHDRQHLIDVFVWQDRDHGGGGPAEGSRNGYNFVHWNRDGMVFWATSDLNAQELAGFVRLWQAA